MRIELRDGQWAELRERITHGQDKEIIRARVRVREDPEAHVQEDVDVALRVFVSAWSVNDLDGRPIPLSDPDAMDRVPSDITDALIGEVLPLYAPATVPNAPTSS